MCVRMRVVVAVGDEMVVVVLGWGVGGEAPASGACGGGGLCTCVFMYIASQRSLV